MDYNLIFGMVAISLIALLGFVYSVKNETKKEQELFNDLKICITKLTEKLDNLTVENQNRDKRLDKHSQEIDDLSERVVVVETKIKGVNYGNKD